MARFFIDRPIFAIVLSVLMVLAGIVAFFQMPLSEYPAVTPPTENSSCECSVISSRTCSGRTPSVRVTASAMAAATSSIGAGANGACGASL